MAARMLLAACALAFTACTVQRSEPLDHGWAPPGACVFVGNRADLHYCATTGTQILANPAVYDGQLVQVSGWVVAPPDEARELAMFLTRDAHETNATHGSVYLSGPAESRIAAYAKRANSTVAAVPVRVSGRFHLFGLAADGSRARQPGNRSFHFGQIEQISEWSP